MNFRKLFVICLTVVMALFLVASPILAAGELVKSPANPVIMPLDAWEGSQVGAPCVILEGFTYKMWYSGVDGAGFPAIGYAYSTDGLNWTKVGTVMVHGGTSAWDSDGVGGACVIFDGTNYQMWYTGLKNLVPAIGHATSLNGTFWTKDTLPVMVGTSSSWDAYGVAFPSVIKTGTTYQMWYTGRSNDSSLLGLLAIGYATSPDGDSWTKSPSNPVLQLDSTGWDNRGVGACSVVRTSPTSYLMYYTGFITGGSQLASIGSATSSDGETWNKSGVAPVLEGTASEWDFRGVAAPSVIIHSGNTRMWYTGAGGEGDLAIGEAHILSNVPASSNLSTALMIAGMLVLIVGVSIWQMRRNKV
jgi:predicted GH43/DUF377 family glycosyl hydrolase